MHIFSENAVMKMQILKAIDSDQLFCSKHWQYCMQCFVFVVLAFEKEIWVSFIWQYNVNICYNK